MAPPLDGCKQQVADRGGPFQAGEAQTNRGRLAIIPTAMLHRPGEQHLAEPASSRTPHLTTVTGPATSRPSGIQTPRLKPIIVPGLANTDDILCGATKCMMVITTRRRFTEKPKRKAVALYKTSGLLQTEAAAKLRSQPR